MTDKKFFSTGDFAKFARTTRRTLHHYDKIGLLSPMSRGENKYRYYSSRQLATLNLIRTLQDLGMTLDEIKIMKDQRFPEYIAEAFTNHVEKINQKIDDWVKSRTLLLTLQKSIYSVLQIDEEAMSIQYMPAEAIILGPLNDYSEGKNDYDALFSFYRILSEQHPGLDLNYPVWALRSEALIKQGKWGWPERYYFYNPAGYDKRPASLYAIGYTRGRYGQSHELYQQMLDYIHANGFEICGNAYEEYPLNELSIADDSNYLARVMISVRETKRSRHKTKTN